nr:sigma 54-interacting transcriptional regulator [Salinisphaera halophila]
MLGGPGSGKTSRAYDYCLARTRGNFVTAEATDDKAAMKSLLCGHVSGAFPGAGSRTGAFSHARDGVCFLDESHGVSGSVMEVLMEALDSNQYLPYGASAKRPLDCAVVFASNRSWDTLIASVNMDEHARLGAMILHLPDLAVRREDLIAVLATTLDGMRRRATTWAAPAGLSQAAWQAIGDCPWRGNTRARSSA